MSRKGGRFGVGLLGLSMGAELGWAQSTLEECLLTAVQSAAESVTVGELRSLCEARVARGQGEREDGLALTETLVETASAAGRVSGGVSKRMALERYTRDNPFVLTPHRPNYLLPAEIGRASSREREQTRKRA